MIFFYEGETEQMQDCAKKVQEKYGDIIALRNKIMKEAWEIQFDESALIRIGDFQEIRNVCIFMENYVKRINENTDQLYELVTYYNELAADFFKNKRKELDKE